MLSRSFPRFFTESPRHRARGIRPLSTFIKHPIMHKAFFCRFLIPLQFTLVFTLLSGITGASAAVPDADQPDEGAHPADNVIAIGAGVERQPNWLGAATHKTRPIPYLDLSWHDQIELSTTDGLSIDVLHGEHWHGGMVGTLMWGRSTRDLGPLANRVNTLNNTEQAGTYLEYAFTKSLSVGARLRHDVQGTGAAYGDIYTELTLPAPGAIEHSIKLDSEAMNGAAMRRFFGVTPEVGTALGTDTYRPNGGFTSIAVSYELFVPTSTHTGISFAIERGAVCSVPPHAARSYMISARTPSAPPCLRRS